LKINSKFDWGDLEYNFVISRLLNEQWMKIWGYVSSIQWGYDNMGSENMEEKRNRTNELDISWLSQGDSIKRK